MLLLHHSLCPTLTIYQSLSEQTLLHSLSDAICTLSTLWHYDILTLYHSQCQTVTHWHSLCHSTTLKLYNFGQTVAHSHSLSVTLWHSYTLSLSLLYYDTHTHALSLRRTLSLSHHKTLTLSHSLMTFLLFYTVILLSLLPKCQI